MAVVPRAPCRIKASFLRLCYRHGGGLHLHPGRTASRGIRPSGGRNPAAAAGSRHGRRRGLRLARRRLLGRPPAFLAAGGWPGGRASRRQPGTVLRSMGPSQHRQQLMKLGLLAIPILIAARCEGGWHAAGGRAAEGRSREPGSRASAPRGSGACAASGGTQAAAGKRWLAGGTASATAGVAFSSGRSPHVMWYSWHSATNPSTLPIHLRGPNPGKCCRRGGRQADSRGSEGGWSGAAVQHSPGRCMRGNVPRRPAARGPATTDWQAGRQAGREAGRQRGWQAGRQAGGLTFLTVQPISPSGSCAATSDGLKKDSSSMPPAGAAAAG